MRASFAIAIATVLATAASATSLGQRADPRFDVYIHHEENCEDKTGETCYDITSADCCSYAVTPPQRPIFTAASYADAGSRQKSSAYGIKLYSARVSDMSNGFDFESCGIQIVKDDTCASSPVLQAATGAMVDDGSGTLRRRGAKPHRTVYTTHYFYRDGIKRWSLAKDSKAGIAFKDIPKGRKEAYLMQHGDLKILV